MAWEQILTSGTGIGKLSDVTITSADAGDVLICDGSGVWVDAVISGTNNEIVVTSTAGAINVKQPDDVTIGQDLTVTRNGSVGGTLGVTLDTTLSADLTVNGGAVTLNAGAVGEDATLTLNGGATAKSAIIALSADAGATVGDNWEVKVADGGVMSFTNDAAALNEQVAMASWTPNSTAASSKLTLAGDLHLGGDLIQFTASEKITRTSGVLAVTAASTTFSGDITVTGNDITFGNGETISNASNGVVAITSPSTTFSGDITVTGNDLTFGNGESISNGTDGTIAITATTTSVSGDLTVTGNDITFGNGETISNATDGTVAVTAATTSFSGDITVTGNDISGSGGSAISIGGVAAGNIDVINNLTVRGNTIYGYVSSSPVEMLQFSGTGDVNVNNDLTVGGDLLISGDTTTVNTATILIEDNILQLNSGLGSSTAPTVDAGFTVNRGSATNDASFFWDESASGAITGTGVDQSSNASDTYGGAWAMGYTESAVTQGKVSNVAGYVVGVTHATSGVAATDARATGLGSLFINTTSDAVYIRVS